MKVSDKKTGKKESLIIADGATPELVSSQFSFTEGPAADKEGNVFFTDQPNNKIWKYSTDGKLSVFMEESGRSNGMFFDPQGNLVTCADEKNELWSITPEGKVSVLMEDFQGKKLNGPNDLWITKDGGIYFTDPFYLREYWKRKSPEIEGEKVYFLPKGAKQPIVVEDEIQKPNGIVGSRDENVLFVADIQGHKTYKYKMDKSGDLKEKQLFVEQGSDGMTLDQNGNVYLTGKGVTVYNSKGEKMEQIDIPEGWTANVCFGGKNKNVLFITASKSLYTLRMKVKGLD